MTTPTARALLTPDVSTPIGLLASVLGRNPELIAHTDPDALVRVVFYNAALIDRALRFTFNGERILRDADITLH